MIIEVARKGVRENLWRRLVLDGLGSDAILRSSRVITPEIQWRVKVDHQDQALVGKQMNVKSN